MPRGVKKHLKRLNAPRHWMLDKLGGVFVRFVIFHDAFISVLAACSFQVAGRADAASQAVKRQRETAHAADNPTALCRRQSPAQVHTRCASACRSF